MDVISLSHHWQSKKRPALRLVQYRRRHLVVCLGCELMPCDLAHQYPYPYLSHRQTSHIATQVSFMWLQPELFHLLPWYGGKSQQLFNLLHPMLDCQQLPRLYRKNLSCVSHRAYRRERRLYDSRTGFGRRERPGLRR